MSFLSIVKKALHFVETVGKEVDVAVNDVEKFVEPLVEKIYPVSTPIFALFDKMQAAIVAAEGAVTAPKSGAVKSQIVSQDFDANLVTVQNLLAQQGKMLVYDVAQQKKAADAQVAAYNEMAVLYTTMKVVDIPKPAGGAPKMNVEGLTELGLALKTAWSGQLPSGTTEDFTDRLEIEVPAETWNRAALEFLASPEANERVKRDNPYYVARRLDANLKS